MIPDITDVLDPTSVDGDADWLAQWSQLLDNMPPTVHVPCDAAHISTPLVFSAWRHLLIAHHNRALIHFFLQGITRGFRIGYCYPYSTLKSSRKKTKSALQHAEVIDDYLAKEAQERRVAGPFTRSVVPNAHVSRFGVIPKAHQPNKWRLIVDLSHPKGASVNDGIPKHLCSMSYITVDDAISRIITLGQGTLLAKIDIQSAFRLIPVHPADRHLLAMEWKGAVYFDTCLPFGLRSTPKLFNVLADLLQWILLNQGVSFLIQYLDDYLTMGPPNSPEFHRNLSLLIEVCAMLGIPLALGKVASEKKRHKKGNPIPSRATTTCSQSSSPGTHVRKPHVQCGSKRTGAGLLHSSKQRVQI